MDNNILNDISSYEEFEKWYLNTFIKRNGGFTPSDLKEWYSKVESRHNKIRVLIGGRKIQKFYDIEACDYSSENKQIDSIGDQICEILPAFLIDNAFDKNIFYKQTIQDSSHSSRKLSKIIAQYSHSYLRNNFSSERSVIDKQKKVESLVSQLGKIWQKSRTSNIKLEITLSTTATGFILLGHCGADRDSCFRQSSTKEKHKYCIAQSNETFVITVGKPLENGKIKNVARYIGFLSNNERYFNLLNLYFDKSVEESDVVQAIKILYKEVFKLDKDKSVNIIENRNMWKQPDIHKNPYGNISLVPQEELNIPEQICDVDQTDIMLFLCPRCRERFKANVDFSEIDNLKVCRYCTDDAKTCNISLKKTFKEMKPFINMTNIIDGSEFDSKGGETLALEEEIKKHCKECEECQTPFLSQDKQICICNSCQDTEYTECDNCTIPTKDNELIELLGRNICKECFEIGVELSGDEIAFIKTVYIR